MKSLELAAVHHRYASQPVLDGVDLRVEDGTFTAVLGESGSGKTTLLRVIAGFERITSGVVKLGSAVLDDGRTAAPPERRKIGYVPQDGALFPHLRVAANVGFGLPRSPASRARVHDLLDGFGLAGLARRYPHELSGGQQQRVALARALAIKPEVVLLDEPFSSLDAAMRSSLSREIAIALKERGTTTVLVTHDQDEALSMADRVAVLRNGRIVVEACPEDLYRTPLDADLAGFLGEANLLSGTVADGVASTALGRFEVLPEVASQGWAGAAVVLIRPEQLALRDAGPGAASDIRGQVIERSYFGHDAVLRVAVARGHDGGPLLVRITGQAAPAPGADIELSVLAPVMAWPAPGGG